MERRNTAVYSVGLPDDDGWWPVERITVANEREHARVRIQTDDAGRLEVRELHLLDNGEPIAAARLRAFNLGTVGQMIGAALIIEQSGEQPKRRRTLKVPAGRGYGDAFYERVADAYRAAKGRPVAAIAAEAGVPRSTAARWVKEARSRGKLGAAPAQGKAGETVSVRPAAEATARSRGGKPRAR